MTEYMYQKLSKKYALNNSYFKNAYGNMPQTPIECFRYFKEHGETPFTCNSEHWIYEMYIEYQKRYGVYNSKFYTPPTTAKRIAELAAMYFDHNKMVYDACCGFGMLTRYCIENGLSCIGFDLDFEIGEVYEGWTNCPYKREDFQDVFLTNTDVISNPPYEIPELTKFFKKLSHWIGSEGKAILLIPKGFLEKTKPKELKSLIEDYTIIHREDMKEDFARTKVKAEIVVLEYRPF